VEAERLDEYKGKVNSRQIRVEIVNATTLRPWTKLNRSDIKEVNVCHTYPSGARYLRPGEHISSFEDTGNNMPYRVARTYGVNLPGCADEINTDGSYVYVKDGMFNAETDIVFVGLTYAGFMRLSKSATQT
jgi:hypothetical protein